MVPPPPEPPRDQLLDEFIALLYGLKRQMAPPPASDLGEVVHGATPQQLAALGALSGCEAMAMTEFAAAQGCAMSTASAMADRLCRIGMAERIHDDNDRRVVMIRATDEARELAERMRTHKHAAAQRLLAPLSNSQLHQLIALLRAIVQPEAAHA